MKFFDRFTEALTYIACFAAVIMMVQTCIDVAGRYLFNSPLTGTIELVGLYYMIMIVFLPLAYVERFDRHIHADVLMGLMPEPVKRVAVGLALVFSSGFFALIGYQSLNIALRSYATGEIAFGSTELILWPSRFVLPIGFGAIALMSAIRLVRETLLGLPAENAPADLDFDEGE
jgi:TRAP-type C4-dicarboxylate transport system permease small subunit